MLGHAVGPGSGFPSCSLLGLSRHQVRLSATSDIPIILGGKDCARKCHPDWPYQTDERSGRNQAKWNGSRLGRLGNVEPVRPANVNRKLARRRLMLRSTLWVETLTFCLTPELL